MRFVWLAVLALLTACGGGSHEDTSGADDPDTGTTIIGKWKLMDTTAADWYAMQGASALYLQVETHQFTWHMQKTAGDTCVALPMERTSGTQFLVSEDASSCTFDASLDTGGTLVLTSRHASDSTGTTWKFYFQRTSAIPGESGSDCVERTSCPRFDKTGADVWGATP